MKTHTFLTFLPKKTYQVCQIYEEEREYGPEDAKTVSD